jgi:hypothetical protein
MDTSLNSNPVIPAQAGFQFRKQIPLRSKDKAHLIKPLDSRLRGNDELFEAPTTNSRLT